MLRVVGKRSIALGAALLCAALGVLWPAAPALAWSYSDRPEGSGLVTGSPEQPSLPPQPANPQQGQPVKLSGISKIFVNQADENLKAVADLEARLASALFNPVILTGNNSKAIGVGEIYDVMTVIAMSLLTLMIVVYGIRLMAGGGERYVPVSAFFIRMIVAALAVRYAPLLMQDVLNVTAYMARVILGGGIQLSASQLFAGQSAWDIVQAEQMSALTGMLLFLGMVILFLAMIIWAYLRELIVYSLFAISPLAIIMAILPETGEIYERWRNAFIKQSLLPIIWALWWKIGSTVLLATGQLSQLLFTIVVMLAWLVGFFSGSNVLTEILNISGDYAMRMSRMMATSVTGKAGDYLVKFAQGAGAMLPVSWQMWIGGFGKSLSQLSRLFRWGARP